MAEAIRAGDLTSSVKKRWRGQRIDNWTRQRAENIRAKSRFVTATKRKRVPSVYDCMLGPRFAQLLVDGKLYPYPLVQRRRRTSEMPPGAKWSLRARHLDALSLVVTAHLACDTQGLIISHATMGGLLGCSPRTAGTTMRQLVEWGLLSSEPWFSSTEGASLRLSSSYQVTAFAARFFDLPTTLSKNCQAERNPPSGDAISVSAVADERLSVPDAAAVLVHAEGVKARPDTSPEAPREQVRANGRVVVVRSALAADVRRLADRVVEREAAPVRQLAARFVLLEEQFRERSRDLELRERDLELRELAGNTGEIPAAADPVDADPLAELRRSVSGVNGWKGGPRR
jgi:hypothetical protein